MFDLRVVISERSGEDVKGVVLNESSLAKWPAAVVVIAPHGGRWSDTHSQIRCAIKGAMPPSISAVEAVKHAVSPVKGGGGGNATEASASFPKGDELLVATNIVAYFRNHEAAANGATG